MKYIGVIDSGLGGITVVKKITEIFPNENIIFFGDTKNMPYGTKSLDRIKELVKEDISFLNTFDLKALVIGCNTIEATSKQLVKSLCNCPTYGVIYPACKKASSLTKNNNIGVLATKATVDSNKYKEELLNINPNINVYQSASINLANLIERNDFDENSKAIENELTFSLQSLIDSNIDTLILGCTHYKLVSNTINRLLPNVNIVSSSDEVVYQLNIENANNNKGEIKFYVSSNPQEVKEKINRLYPNFVDSIYLKD